MMAATSTPEALDPALLRAGRFDHQVVVDRPDLQWREAILNVHERNVKLDPQVELKTIAARTPGDVNCSVRAFTQSSVEFFAVFSHQHTIKL